MSEQYQEIILSLFPEGFAWPRQKDTALRKLINAFAAEAERVDQRTKVLITESDPRTTNEKFSEWENIAGLPDPCLSSAPTAEQSRKQLVQKITSIGNQSKQYFIDVAAVFGYEITIDEINPFICGSSECGDSLNGGTESYFYWRVNVTGTITSFFTCGESEAGEALGSFVGANDLECILNRLKPAHTQIIFSYVN